MRRVTTRGLWAIAMTGAAAITLNAAAAASGPAIITPPGTQVFNVDTPPNGTPGQHSADEPSIGANWNSGAIMYLANTTVLKVTYNDATNPPTPTWTDKSGTLTSVTSFDPILFTDPVTGRTIVSQLDLGCSLSEYTDTDGDSWSPSSGCAFSGSEDHQSVGGGPLHAPLPTPPPPAYPHGVYYCNQDGGALIIGGGTAAYCGISLDGGATYSPGRAIYFFDQCGGLHGHIRVAPDGTAVVPNQNCAATADPTLAPDVLSGHMFPNQAAVVSTDNGLTWTVHVIPGSHSSLRSDPSLAFDSNNTMYFGYEDGTYAGGDVTTPQIGGRAMIAVSPDDGATWGTPVDVGAPLGIQNVTFPEVIAGGPGRAAYAFLGSTTGGNPEDTTFQGLWDLYVSFTYDGGVTWSTEDLTPTDPVQRACIYLAGNGTCPSVKRNLLDFMDMTVDKQGRTLVGYADGCTGTCVTDLALPCSNAQCSTGPTASTDKLVSIARLTCGKGLFVDYDSLLACPLTVSTPEVPWVPLTVLLGGGAVALAVRRERGRARAA